MTDADPSLVRMLSDAAFVTDERDEVLDWDEAAERLLGVQRGRAIGCSVARLPMTVEDAGWRVGIMGV